MTAKEFLKRWRRLNRNAELARYNAAMFEGRDLPHKSIAFLLEAGLPKSAAPYINMEQPHSNILATVADEWRMPEIPRRYLWLGSDGEGSPICIEEGSGVIWLLDHEFDFKPVFMNTALSDFAAFLMAIGEFVQEMDADAEYAELDVWESPELASGPKRELAEKLLQIDAAAFESGNFWRQELVNFYVFTQDGLELLKEAAFEVG